MPINHPALATAGVVAISVAVAAAIAVYESPELRRLAEDLRRKIALAFHNFGDVIDPHHREPLFNRPEDANGFLHSRGSVDPGVVADDETRRRQREELMYWNAIHLEKQARELTERAEGEKSEKIQSPDQPSELPRPPRRSTTFDDFLSPDHSAAHGTYVFNTGANVYSNDQGLVHRRPAEAGRGLHSSVFSNPFTDDHRIMDEQQASFALMAPGRDELPEKSMSEIREDITSDIYDIPTPKRRSSVPQADTQSLVVSLNSQEDNNKPTPPAISFSPKVDQAPSTRSATMDHEPTSAALVAGAQSTSADAFSSIQAWAEAQTSNPSFYSPIPVSPAAPLSVASEPDVISHGDLTPNDTDSLSLAGSGVDIGNEAGSRAGDNFDVMSESDGMVTPVSWTEVGSVVSEDDQPVRA